MSQVIFSFIPTVIATLLEPFWVLVGRYLALYQPYIALHKGNASPASFLGLKYTNIPPVLIAPRALRHGHPFLFLASMMVITANILAVALGGIFDRSSQLFTSDIMVTYPFATSINAEILAAYTPLSWQIFAKDLTEPWLVVNTNVFEGTDLPIWVTDEFYFLPFEWESGNKTGLRTSMTQGYGGNLKCQLLSGNTFQQSSQMDSTGSGLEIKVTMPISGGDPVRCWGYYGMDVQLLKSGTHPFAAEWVWSLGAAPNSDQKATQPCNSLILAGWGRGEATPGMFNGTAIAGSVTSVNMQSNTTIICTPQIATGEFRVTVDEEGHVKRSKLIGELKFDDPGIFNHSTAVGNFTAQLAILLSTPPRRANLGVMHSDHLSHSFPQFIGEHLINKNLSDPSAPPPSFEDAQQALSKFYKRLFAILFAQNQDRIFAPAGNLHRSEVGQLESLEPRMSMDPVMFYIAAAILGFQLIAGTIIFASTPRRFLPKFPYNLASEISFFYASSALSEVAGIANTSSAMHRRHLKRLGGTYGYGSFRGSDGERHVGIERMSMIRGYKEAAVTTSASSTTPETTPVVRAVAAVTSASSSPPAEGVVSVEGAVSAAGDAVVPVLAVDQIRAQAIGTVDVGTSVSAVTGSLGGSTVAVVVASGEDDLELVA